jgi:hypothetical protein
MIEFQSLISLFDGFSSAVKAYENFKKVSAIIRGEPDKIDVALQHLENINNKLEVVRLSEHIVQVPSIQSVRDITQTRQRQIELTEVRESLDPLQRALNSDLLASAMILTPDKMRQALGKNPWEVLEDISPVNFARPHYNPNKVPIIFEHQSIRYLGWLKRGLLPVVFDCQFEDLFLSEETPKELKSEQLQKIREEEQRLQQLHIQEEHHKVLEERLRKEKAAAEARIRAEKIAAENNQRLEQLRQQNAELQRQKELTDQQKALTEQLRKEKAETEAKIKEEKEKSEAKIKEEKRQLQAQIYEEQAKQYLLKRGGLSELNPLDWWRLLIWVLWSPVYLKVYKEIFDKDDGKFTGVWLASTLIWLPLLLTTFSLGLTMPLPMDWNAQAPLILCGIIIFAWFLTALFLLDNDLESVSYVLISIGTIIVFIFSPFIILFIEVITAIIIGVCVDIVENSKTGTPSNFNRFLFILLIASYAFLIWFLYLKGWQYFK